MQKDDQNVHAFQNRNWCSPKSDWWFFFSNFDCQYISIGRILSGKKWGGTRFISEKTEALHAELNERDEAATSGYQCNRRVFTIYYSLLAHTNHQKLWSRCSVHGIFLQILFNDINHGYRAAVLKKNLCGCFCFIWLWLLTAIMKRCPELCTLQFHCTSLTLCTTFLGRSGFSNSQTGPENHYGYF